MTCGNSLASDVEAELRPGVADQPELHVCAGQGSGHLSLPDAGCRFPKSSRAPNVPQAGHVAPRGVVVVPARLWLGRWLALVARIGLRALSITPCAPRPDGSHQSRPTPLRQGYDQHEEAALRFPTMLKRIEGGAGDDQETYGRKRVHRSVARFGSLRGRAIKIDGPRSDELGEDVQRDPEPPAGVFPAAAGREVHHQRGAPDDPVAEASRHRGGPARGSIDVTCRSKSEFPHGVQRRARRRPKNLVCAVVGHAGLRIDRLMSRRAVTRCDAGTEAESTGVKSRPGWAGAAGASGRQLRAGLRRRQRLRR